MRTLTKLLIGLLALVLIVTAAAALAWRVGLLDPVLARLDLDQIAGVGSPRGDPQGWDLLRDRDARAFLRDGRDLDRRGIGSWLSFGRLPLVGGLALIGALTVIGGLAALAVFGLRAVTRRNPPPAPPAPPA